GGDSPAAQLWNLSDRSGDLKEPAATFADPSVTRNITCAAIRPRHNDYIVTGHSDGDVHVWRFTDGKATLETPRLIAREFAGAVNALCFTPDGDQLAAAGDGTRIWLGTMEPEARQLEVLERLRPHHYEQINALATWPDQPILISGSDDTTIRFW